MYQDSLVGLGVPERTSRSLRGGALLRHRDRGEALYYGSTTEELRYIYAGDASSVRDDCDRTGRRGVQVWNHLQFSSPI